MGALAGSAVLRRVTDANKVAQFTALLRASLQIEEIYTIAQDK